MHYTSRWARPFSWREGLSVTGLPGIGEERLGQPINWSTIFMSLRCERLLEEAPGREEVRLSQPNLDWLEEHFQELDTKYCGKWVAIHARAVVAYGDTLAEARRKAIQLGYERALFTCFGPGTWGR